MPTIPKFLDVLTHKRSVEVFRRFNSEYIAGSYSHIAVSGKIKEQVYPVYIEVNRYRVPCPSGSKVIHNRVETCCNYHLVNHALEYLVYAFS